MIFAELKKYVVRSFGADGWNALTREAGAEGKIYLPSKAYGDEELFALVAAGSLVTGTPAQDLVEGFGRFLASDLVLFYGAHINPSWRCLDLLEHTETTMHRIVRTRNPEATPPRLKVERIAPDTVLITYTSERQLCALARGIVHGVAAHYAEPVEVRDETCMHRGDPSCQIRVRAIAAA